SSRRINEACVSVICDRCANGRTCRQGREADTRDKARVKESYRLSQQNYPLARPSFPVTGGRFILKSSMGNSTRSCSAHHACDRLPTRTLATSNIFFFNNLVARQVS